MKKTVIFDLDGTLVDSRHNIAEAINFAREAKGLPPMSHSDVFSSLNALTFESAKSFYGQDASASDHAVFERRYEEICLIDLKLYDQIADLLAALADRGVKLAVATNATSRFARVMLDYAGVSRYFALMLGADNVARPKPAPDMLLLALEQTNAVASEAVFLGDSPKDMKAAASAAIDGVFAAWGYGNAAKADRVAQTPMDLLDIIGA
ncbi:MAG: HAD family hydrolase [Helicobacteraceae bacterium]|jgi:phosphoglycolate phosphatase|nr:HAD family hydrolase [Helicobacteraceae bacterium]